MPHSKGIRNRGGKMMINKTTWGALIGALGATFVAALCCSPLLIIFFGVGGVLASYITFFVVYRPYIVLLVGASLGYSFYKLYIKPPPCGVGAACLSPTMLTIQRWIFWIISIISIVILSLPTC